MNIVSTRKEIIDSLQKQVEWLKKENKELRLIISRSHLKSECTCGIHTKECVSADDWIKCPVHGFRVKNFERGEL